MEDRKLEKLQTNIHHSPSPVTDPTNQPRNITNRRQETEPFAPPDHLNQQRNTSSAPVRITATRRRRTPPDPFPDHHFDNRTSALSDLRPPKHKTQQTKLEDERHLLGPAVVLSEPPRAGQPKLQIRRFNGVEEETREILGI